LYFSLLSEKSKEAYEMTTLSVCLSDSHQLLNRLVDFQEIWYGRDDIEGDHDAIIFNPTASTVLKWLRFRINEL
jgi:hypothetical protein